jgi:hypothetical protein
VPGTYRSLAELLIGGGLRISEALAVEIDDTMTPAARARREAIAADLPWPPSAPSR